MSRPGGNILALGMGQGGMLPNGSGNLPVFLNKRLTINDLIK
jgi:hypothetical protein